MGAASWSVAVDASVSARSILGDDGWREVAGLLRRAASVDHVFKETANAI